MLDALSRPPAGEGSPRQLEKRWDSGLIAASIAISLLGAFTSTQLMCQARTSRYMSGVLVWTALGSLTFGFCSIWALHEVAMLACELDLPIRIDVPLTILSSILAVAFTFAALASDLVWERYKRTSKRKRRGRSWDRKQSASENRMSSSQRRESIDALLHSPDWEDDEYRQRAEPLSSEEPSHSRPSPSPSPGANDVVPFGDRYAVESRSGGPSKKTNRPNLFHIPQTATARQMSPGTGAELLEEEHTGSEVALADSDVTSTDGTMSRRSSSFGESNASTLGLGKIMSIRTHRKGKYATENVFYATAMILYTGLTLKNLVKGFFWSLAITSMHYVGLSALRIPQGHLTLHPILVTSSAMISWVVCSIGCILMSQMETHLAQQILFSIVATLGVAAMHFTGMRAATFWSYESPSEERGYPPGLAIAIASIAIFTCIGANGLLAHSATLSRNKLAEVVQTRKKLWMAIAQKETAEAAAAARSEFIASASHEIRTPLHQLQGYSDLLSRTELTQEGRLLLYAIQHATKTLSLITTNVLDWSRLEKDGEAVCRPVALDMRTVCESTVNFLPNKDDDVDVELMVVVAPNVPHSLLLDETYMHRILMNLLSNAIKFTPSGYILLLVEMKGNDLVAVVKDTGHGIPPSFLPQLFEPFKQAQTRGAQRGTGLGLSIIQQLLNKMQGRIEVQSWHQEEVGPEQCGTTFTVTMPMRESRPPSRQEDGPAEVKPRIAIMHGGPPQVLEGLRTAWEKFEFEVVVATSMSDVTAPLKYIWVDLSFLKQNPAVLHDLLVQEQWLVIVPCDTQNTLYEVVGPTAASHFIPLQKPLIWHSIMQSISAAGQPSNKASVPRTVRFASTVDILESVDEENRKEQAISKSHVILLVEDNKINLKLGTKMLTTLGYQVLVAEDGQEAIDQIVRHDDIVDAILMDQSMPRKDGLTATKEIRAMEQAGKLKRRRPIIAVTAVVSSESQTLSKSAGTDDFLAKPLSLGRLETTLAAHLSPKTKCI